MGSTTMPGAGPGELRLRLIYGAAMAALALAAAFAGGVGFSAFWAAAACLVAYEWSRLFAGPNSLTVAVFSFIAIVAATVLLNVAGLPVALLAVCAGTAAAGIAAGPSAGAGVLYAAPIALGPILLRNDPVFGLAAIMWLFAVVWGTDIAAYFGGRAMRGPLLWPAVSPKKTWSGAISGALAAIILSLAVAAAFGLAPTVALVFIGLLGSVATQAGDLLESSIKRHRGVKDAGQLIPGHGGLMDRLDGFVLAVLVAAMIGCFRMGPGASAQGLLQW